MNIYHKLDWGKCLSHEIWEAFKKGWPESDEEVHFFWGLAGKNKPEIAECMRLNKTWFYVDVGYFTKQITRYPEPKIHDYDKTYFRIVKGGLHTIRGHIGTGQRITELEHNGIDMEFKGWNTGETKHVLLCPSSQMVTYEINGMTQEQWIEEAINDLKQYTDREIRLRNKPRPNNQWWGTDIKDELIDCHCLVTNMSLSAIDAIMNKVPVICHERNVCSPVTSRESKFIEKPFRPGKKTMTEWLKFVVENQFTIPEISSGKAFEIFKEQLV